MNLMRRLASRAFPSSSPPTRQESENEAINQAIGRASQVDVATDMVFLEDLREIGEQERQAVDEYRAKKLGLKGSAEGKKMRGDRSMILCDNYQNGIGAVATAILCAATLFPTLVGGAALVYSLMPKAETPAVENRPFSDRFNEYDLERWVPTDEEKAEIDRGSN